MSKPVIAITMGDPAGIGPELCVRLVGEESILSVCEPIVYGNYGVLERVAGVLGVRPPPRERVRECGDLDAAAVTPGKVDPRCGEASYRYVVAAIEDAMAGRVAALCTGPIHKEAWHAAGVPYPGHTELLAARTGAAATCMMLTAASLTCSLVTGHVGLRDVPVMLSEERIYETIWMTAAAMRRIRGRPPRLAVCGLNPHAGEHGLFGASEEERFIVPAIARAVREGLEIVGPLPPDTAFVPHRRAVTDAYICMYHDQGLIPLKALAFDEAVHVTLGLPIVRTSVDHGTAYDIAWQGKASHESFRRAIELAVHLCK